MPALFSLALHPALQHIKASLPQGSHVLAYLDDIYIVCDRDDVAESLRMAQHVLSDVCHIDINSGKLAAWSKDASQAPVGLQEFGDNIWRSDAPADLCGIKVLGTPLGTQEYISTMCQKLADEKI